MEASNEQLLYLLDLQVKKLEDLKKHMGNLSGLLEDQSKKIEQIRYSAAIPMQGDYFEKVGAQQLSSWETIQTIAERRMSFARFGDGELGLAADPNRNIRFQRGSMDLARALRGGLK